MTFIRSIVSDNILTLAIENTLADARIMMVENDIRHITIVDDGQSYFSDKEKRKKKGEY